MYISLPLPLKDIKSQITKKDKICVLFCSAGARVSGYGGVDGANNLTTKLKDDGYNVVYTTTCGNPCNRALVKQVAENRVFKGIDTIIISGCNGFLINTEAVFPDKKVVKAFTNTYGNGMVHMQSNTLVLNSPYMPALQELGFTKFPEEGLPFGKLVEAYMQKYGVKSYPPW